MRAISRRTLFTVFFGVLAAAVIPPINSYAHFEDNGCGARAAGTANAYTAQARGPEAIYFNPAAIALAEYSQFSSSYSRLLWGLTDGSHLSQGFIGFIYPFNEYCGVGLAVQSLMLSEYYSETVVYASFARRMSEKLTVGMNIKILRKEYKKIIAGSSVFRDGSSKTKLTQDIAAIYDIDDSNRIGLMLRNLTSPDMAISPDDEDNVPAGARLGYMHKMKSVNVLLDADHCDGDTTVYGGAEAWVMEDVFALRGGMGMGSRDYKIAAMGMSVKYRDIFWLDYAFNHPLSGIKETNGTHKLALTVTFGQAAPASSATREDIARSNELYSQGVDEFEKGNFDEARKYFLSAYKYKNLKPKKAKDMLKGINTLHRDKNRMMSMLKRVYLEGVQHLNRKDFGSAVEKFLEVALVDTKGWEDIKELADKASKKMFDVKTARQEYITKLTAESAELEEKQKYLDAIDVWTEIKRVNPVDPSIPKKIKALEILTIPEYYRLGMKLYLGGKYLEARTEFKKVLRIDEDHPQAKQMIKVIDKEINK